MLIICQIVMFFEFYYFKNLFDIKGILKVKKDSRFMRRIDDIIVF